MYLGGTDEEGGGGGCDERRAPLGPAAMSATVTGQRRLIGTLVHRRDSARSARAAGTSSSLSQAVESCEPSARWPGMTRPKARKKALGHS
jgi:hypothetical protein